MMTTNYCSNYSANFTVLATLSHNAITMVCLIEHSPLTWSASLVPEQSAFRVYFSSSFFIYFDYHSIDYCYCLLF